MTEVWTRRKGKDVQAGIAGGDGGPAPALDERFGTGKK
jgi:hypothetical protein